MLTEDRAIARKILYEYELVPIELEGAGQGAGLLSRNELDPEAGQGIPERTILDDPCAGSRDRETRRRETFFRFHSSIP